MAISCRTRRYRCWPCQATAPSRPRVVFIKRPGSLVSWRRIHEGAVDVNGAFKSLDVSPLDADHVFVIRDYTTLFLFEVSTETWTTLPLPEVEGAVGRPQFVRVSRSEAGPAAIDIWCGTGSLLQGEMRASATFVKAILDDFGQEKP